MAKEDVVAAQLLVVQAEQTQAVSDGLGNAYDAGLNDGKAIGGGLSQSDVDAAVAAQLAADSAKETQDLSDAQGAANAQLSVVQQQLADMTAQDTVDKAALANLKGSLDQIQANLDAIKALLNPAPPPAA